MKEDKKRKKHLSVIGAFLALFLACGGGCNVAVSSPTESSLSASVEDSGRGETNYKEEYAVDDIVKTENMMFDVESLYATRVTFEVLGNTVPNVAKYAGIQGGFINGVDYLGEETKVFVYYGIPQTEAPEGGFPAVVLVHGAGGTAYYE